MSDKKWIQKSIKRKGRVRNYVLRKIGPDGFTSSGTIKISALKEAKRLAKKSHDVGMEDAINLALRLKRMKRTRR
jgi:hypothetical protein